MIANSRFSGILLAAATGSAWCGSGVVLDSLGVPVEHAKVVRKSDGAATMSDASGRWSMDRVSAVGKPGGPRSPRNGRIVVEDGRLTIGASSGRDMAGRIRGVAGPKTPGARPVADRASIATDSVTATASGWGVASAVYDPEASDNVVVLRMEGSMGMVPIRGGFDSLGGESQANNVLHVVRVAGFWMDTVEVTQKLFDSLMGFDPSYHADCPACPVERVTWFDALRFCNARSRAEGLPEAYDLSSRDSVTWTWDPRSPGYRLPTDAEWEFAARAGSSSDWYWGQFVGQATVGKYAWYDMTSGDSTHPVGGLLPNGFGLRDLSGNVAEWTWDWFSDPTGDTLLFPRGSSRNLVRKGARGGDFTNLSVELALARRLPVLPTSRWLALGFRCARGVMP